MGIRAPGLITEVNPSRLPAYENVDESTVIFWDIENQIEVENKVDWNYNEVIKETGI